MKKVFKYFVISIFLFLFFICSVYAKASFSGAGSPGSSSGGGGGGSCKNNYCFQGVSPVINFSLVDVSNDSGPILYSSSYMINKVSAKSYDDIFLNPNQNRGWGASCAGCIIGRISSSEYDTGAYVGEPFPDDISFSSAVLDKIIPNAASKYRYINFTASELRNAVIDDSREEGVTESYEKVVLYLLKKAGLISDEIQKYVDINLESRIEFNKYRIIVEPVYALKKDDYHFIFATSKAIGALSKKGNNYSLYENELTHNLYASEETEAINKGGYKDVDINNKWESLANVKNGSGYAMIQLSYEDIPHDCVLEKTGSSYNYNYTGPIPGPFYIDATDADTADNLQYFLDKCSCDTFDASIYKDELLNSNALFRQIYDNNCPPPVSKSCEYEYKSGSYIFYKLDSSTTTDYGAFVKSCGCSHSNVKTLKSTFSSEYDAQGCNNTKDIKVEGSFKTCPSTDNKITLTETEKFSTKYTTTSEITCTRTCIENVELENVPDTRNDTYMAGQYFTLSKYPRLVEEKSCEVKFNYSDWYYEYNKELSNLVKKYNNWKIYVNLRSKNKSDDYDCDPDIYGNYRKHIKIYYYSFTGFKVDSDGKTITTDSKSDTNFAEHCGGYDYSTEEVNAKKEYDAAAIKVADLQAIIKRCDALVNFSGTNDSFYKPDYDLSFYYKQTVLHQSASGTVLKDVLNDSSSAKMKATEHYHNVTCTGENVTDGCEFENKYNYDTIKLDSKDTTTVRIGNDPIKRTSVYEYDYEPSKTYYVSPFTGVVSESSSGTYLGNVYSIDINAIKKNDNENYFVFNSVGNNPTDSNSLQKLIKKSNPKALYRYCKYKTDNEVISCEGSNCPKNMDINVVYRMVDSSNIDPNGRLTDGDDTNGFKNWDNKKGETVKKRIEETAKNNNTYNPNNLEYQFYLDSATIKNIREYNKDVNYASTEYVSVLDCNDAGNECLSKFIDAAYEGKSLNGVSINKFANSIRGREDKWKYLKCTSSSNCQIVEQTRNSSLYGSLTAYEKRQDELRNKFIGDSKNKELNP